MQKIFMFGFYIKKNVFKVIEFVQWILMIFFLSSEWNGEYIICIIWFYHVCVCFCRLLIYSIFTRRIVPLNTNIVLSWKDITTSWYYKNAFFLISQQFSEWLRKKEKYCKKYFNRVRESSPAPYCIFVTHYLLFYFS